MNNIEFVSPTDIRKIKLDRPEKFYDLTVSKGENSFYISKAEHLYLVHNCDGGHITALLVNLFFKWFSYVIDEGKLYRLKIPLLSVGDGKKRQFFFNKEEYDKWQKGKHKSSTLRFLKGLGSLAEEDWEVIMDNKQLQQLRHDKDAARYLDMAFGRDSIPRKQWLQGKFK